ncbi:hypothetical protein BG015_004582 [Linnemannia schmuckeri]|uniref:F-box domain-containing protein n=1 Tax=Linnemannia schmuckeri TaxID=64567 RepID=A0A9P5RAS7_9FUNG|nr:hypothetical protein BG015_004582 [Linnemannia schmuckeri]
MSTAASSSACHRFLAIPELVAELAGCLDIKSLHRLMLTNRRLSTFCEPSVYRCVVLNSLDRCSFERIASRDYLAALARNVQHVKSLDSGLLFAVYQFHSALAFQQQERDKEREQEQEQEREQGDTTRAPLSIRGLFPIPEWTPLPDILSPQMELVLLPPMCNLTHFKMNFNRLIHHRLHSAYLPSYDSPSRSLLQATWLIHQSPHLVDIDMDHVGLESFRDIYTLPTVIYGLNRLRRLRLHFSLPRSEWGFLGSTLFFSCPPSLRHLRIEMFYTNSALTDPGLLALSAPPPRRQEPLLELKSFFVQQVLATTTQEFLSHFWHCPELEELHIPKIDHPGLDIVTITQFIGSHCRNLRSITQDNYQPGQALPLSLGILETMTPQSLQKVNCIQCFERETLQNDFSVLFHRHSTTLRSIELSPCWQIRSNTLRTILCECRSLEVFVMIQADSPSHCGIDLVDAVAAPWVCTNLARLFLVVNLQDCREPSPSSASAAPATTISGREDDSISNENEAIVTEAWKPYYERAGPVVFTAKEEEQFRLLEIFYRQLGQLTQLEYINLKAQLDTDFGENDWANEMQQWLIYQRNPLPGMLSLGDPNTGRPGFLHFFTGWKKLKSLLGSVALDTVEARKTVRLEEMKFMLEQWPALTQVEFMQVEEPVEEVVVDGGAEQGLTALEWLQEKRPDIEIVL